MNHFNLKSLAFYGVAIGSVLVLFKAVSAYGESQLKAPNKIGGIYRLEAQNLPVCLQTQDLVVNIEQSGIYLFGDLSAKSPTEQENRSDRLKVPLEGKIARPELSMSGKLNKLTSCQQFASANGKDTFTVTGKIEDKTFSGKILWNNNFTDTTFTAKLDESETSQEEK